MSNPFYYGGHVNPEQFVGRKAELQRIFAGLEVAHTGQMQSFSVVGSRRIGKSSLLFYLTNKYSRYLAQPANYRFAYVDLQDALCKTMDGLLRKILLEFKVVSLPKPLTLAKWQDEIFKLKTGGSFPVICLDEFEDLSHKADVFGHDLYDCWRHLISENAMAFVTASKTSMIDLKVESGHTSSFFNVFTYLPLGELADDEARELIARGADCDYPFTPTEQNEAWRLADNHPYKLQLVGNLLYQAKADGGAIDWVKLRNNFVQQLKQVGLEADMKRTIKTHGRNSKDTVVSATKSGIGEIFKAFLDYISHPT
jgi:hypothetical protein